MENIQTVIKNINASKRVALVLPSIVSTDVLCAAFGLESALKSGLGKEVSLFSAGIIPNLPFISNAPRIFNSLGTDNFLTIKVSNENVEAGELRYEKAADGLMVYITPKSGKYTDRDVSVLPSQENFDLVIILGSSNFEDLGSLYTENSKLFFNTQSINIDVNPNNEYFGTVNLVEPTISSLSELVLNVIEGFGSEENPFKINQNTATSLLAGIVAQTSSFRDPKTTPSAFLKASNLVSAGAEQQKIIQYLYKTKSLPLLQLRRRALARLPTIPEKQILTANVTASDLEKTHMPIKELPEVLRDLIEMVTGYSLFVLLAEIPSGGIQLLIAGLPHEKITTLLKTFSSKDELVTTNQLTGKYEYFSTHLSITLAEAQNKLNQVIENRHSVL